MTNLIVCDAETFYDRTFSLSKLTTEEYIRHELFETIGWAVKVNDEPAQWFSGPKREVKQWLDQFPWGDSIAVAHNAAFDMAILNWHFDIRPKRIADTLSMLRAIDGPDAGNSLAKAAERYGVGKKGDEVVNALGKRRLDFTPQELARYGEYCINDVELTYKLFEHIAPLLPASELRLIDLTIRMFTEPTLELDRDVLEEHLTEVREKKQKLMDAITADKSVLMSNPKLAELLMSLKVAPPTKVSPRTGKTTWAFGKTDEAFKELLDHPDPRVQTIVAARIGVKSTLQETRTERFISIANRGTLPVPLRYYAAHTGRFGGCLVDDTQVTVYDPFWGVCNKRIVDVLLDDLVWDGEEFVSHDGVVFSGFAEVIEWDGVKGTEDHVVFTDAGEMSLREAMQGNHRIKTGGDISEDAVDAARKLLRNYKNQDKV
jgi:DNA polymerase I-like protein with 3'-5' exonuclease and polymerase domains